MASLKTLLFVSLMVAATATPSADAQLLGGIGGLIGNVLGLIRIQGSIFCSVNGTSVNAATPAFSNAPVQLQCGGNVVSTATTNGSGIFSIILDPVQFVLSTLLSGCNLRVNTPLSSCNATLPSIGNLISSLQLIGNTLQGTLNIENIIPGGFQLV